jgi:hypothetical protein
VQTGWVLWYVWISWGGGTTQIAVLPDDESIGMRTVAYKQGRWGLVSTKTVSVGGHSIISEMKLHLPCPTTRLHTCQAPLPFLFNLEGVLYTVFWPPLPMEFINLFHVQQDRFVSENHEQTLNTKLLLSYNLFIGILK